MKLWWPASKMASSDPDLLVISSDIESGLVFVTHFSGWHKRLLEFLPSSLRLFLWGECEETGAVL